MYTYFQLLPYTFHKSLIAIHGLIQLSSAPRFLGTPGSAPPRCRRGCRDAPILNKTSGSNGDMRRLVRICGQPFGDRFCTIYQLLLVVLAEFFYIDIFSIHFFWICRIQLLPQVCGGKPCTVCSTSHSPTLLEPVPIQPSLTWSHCVSFRLHYSPACNSSQFSTSSTFSPHTFYGFFTLYSKMKTKREVFHIKSYFSLASFAGMYTPLHSVLKGPWQFPFPAICSRGTESPCL